MIYFLKTPLFKLFLILIFISSCNYLNKFQDDDTLIFVGETSAINKSKVNSIISPINKTLNNLSSYCKSKSLKSAKSLARDLEFLHKLAGSKYEENKYSINDVTIKDGDKNVDLGLFLQDVHSILNSSHRMKYSDIQSSSNFQSACNALSNNYEFSYRSYYNISESIDLKKELSPWALKVYKSIQCLCG